VVRDEESAASAWVDEILEELVQVCQISHQLLRPRDDVFSFASPELPPDMPDVVVGQAEELQVAANLASRSRIDLEDCIGTGHSEVLEEWALLAGSKEEPVAQEMADVVLHPPPRPMRVDLSEEFGHVVLVLTLKRCVCRRKLKYTKIPNGTPNREQIFQEDVP